MKIKKIWYDEDGITLIEKELDLRLCSGESPVSLEITLTDEGTCPSEAIYIDYEKLLKYLKRGKK